MRDTRPLVHTPQQAPNVSRLSSTMLRTTDDRGVREIREEVVGAAIRARDHGAAAKCLQFDLAAITIPWIDAAHVQPGPARRQPLENPPAFPRSGT
jgi:hypothetical protein